MLCPGSAADEGELRVEYSSEAAQVGTAVHDALRQLSLGQVSLGQADWDWTPPIEACAVKHGLTDMQRRDLVYCCESARRFWGQYGSWFAEGAIEAPLQVVDGGVLYTGTPDLVSMHVPLGDQPALVRVLDWKTTRLDIDYRAQMMAYLWLAMQDRWFIKRHYQYVLAFLRDRTFVVSLELSGAQVEAEHQAFVERVIKWDGKTFSPGEHCQFCPNFLGCPAHLALAKRTVLAVRVLEEALPPTKPAEIVDLYQRVKVLMGLCEKFHEHVKAVVAQQPEHRLITGGATDLVLTQEKRESIKAKEGWPVLTNHLTLDELALCVKVNKGDVLEAVTAKAPHGQKGKRRKQVVEELRAADAVTVTIVPTLRAVRAKALPQPEQAKQIGADDGGASESGDNE
jgi:hypothetical protein